MTVQNSFSTMLLDAASYRKSFCVLKYSQPVNSGWHKSASESVFTSKVFFYCIALDTSLEIDCWPQLLTISEIKTHSLISDSMPSLAKHFLLSIHQTSADLSWMNFYMLERQHSVINLLREVIFPN